MNFKVIDFVDYRGFEVGLRMLGNVEVQMNGIRKIEVSKRPIGEVHRGSKWSTNHKLSSSSHIMSGRSTHFEILRLWIENFQL